MQNNKPYCFTSNESLLYELLLDFPVGDQWHIRDLLIEVNLEQVAPSDEVVGPTLEAVKSCIPFINRELAKNPEIFPPETLREGHYPFIRQMRDVHQFDVGSHLAYCHALAIRHGSLDLLRDRGFKSLVQSIEEALDELHPSVGSAASVFHDFFKCFRRRRPLPGKLGSAGAIKWLMPDGTTPDPSLAADEERIAMALLPEFISDSDLCSQVQRAIEVSGEVGRTMYELLAVTSLNDARALADSFWSKRLLDHRELAGVFIGAIDWLGKGYVQYIVTERKRRKRSLEEAGTLLYAAGEKTIRQ